MNAIVVDTIFTVFSNFKLKIYLDVTNYTWMKAFHFLLFFRCPDSSGVKKKMIYASSKDAVAKKLEGIQVNIQCNDLDEISYAEVIEQASKGKAKF